MDMDIDSSDDDNLNQNSPTLQSFDKRAEAESGDIDNIFEKRHGKEEGEIESDISSSADISPERTVQIASEGMFSEKTHVQYPEDSDDDLRGQRDTPLESQRNREVSKDNDHSSGSSYSDYDDDDNDAEVSRDAPDDSMLGTKENYREVKMMLSSDEDMSSDEEEKPSVEERRDTDELSVELSASDSETSSDEDDREEQKGAKGRDGSKDTDIIDISPDENSADVMSIGIKGEKDSDQGSLREKKLKEDKRTVQSSSESDSESDAEEESKYSKPKSLVFKKKGKSDNKKDNSGSGKRNRSDEESEEAVVDHLDIVAPQQALLRDNKRKSSKVKVKKHSKSEKSGSTGERSKHRDEKRMHREDKVRSDSREREKDRRDKRDDSYEKKHRRHGDIKHSKYDTKSEQGLQKSRSIIEKKRVEEDLRRTLLQKRSTREEVAIKQLKGERAERETSKKEEKYHKDKEKLEKSKSDHSARSKKEGKEKGREKEEVAVKKAKTGKETKESKRDKEPRKDRDRDKSSRTVTTDKGKKRPREKTKSKSARDKYRSESESSEEEAAEREPSKPASKRPRSADPDKAKEPKAGKSPEEKKGDSKTAENDYDDISPVSSEVELTPPPSPVELKKPTYYPAIMGCRDVKEFQWLNKIEEGTYGVVYRARDIRTNEIVALKRLKMEKEKEGFPITSLREINTLLKAQHPNIVTVREIVVGSNMDKIYIVMDYVEHDLKALMETMTQPFLVGEVKTLMIQLLRGVNHMHDNWILHRDIKASNLLLSHKGILKVGDFGLAREYGSPLKNYTPIVVTLWYRAPELLLGGKEYKTAIDLWSVGCVFAELLLMKPLFPGKSEVDQINRIFKELGTPNDKIWPGPPAYSEYSLVKKTNFANHPYNVLRNRFGATFTDKGFNLLNRFLTYDPKKRITAEEALHHEYFEESPLPVDPSMFPTWPAKSELGHRAARKQNASPKPPEGGGAALKLANQDANLGFHMPATTKGISAKGGGFNLKF